MFYNIQRNQIMDSLFKTLSQSIVYGFILQQALFASFVKNP